MELKEAIKYFEGLKDIEYPQPLNSQILAWLKELQIYRESEMEYIGEEEKEKCEILRKNFDKVLERGTTLFVLTKDIKVRNYDVLKGTVLELYEDYGDTAPLFKLVGSDMYAYIDIGILEPVTQEWN